MGCRFLLQGELPDPGIKPVSATSPALLAYSAPLIPQGSPKSWSWDVNPLAPGLSHGPDTGPGTQWAPWNHLLKGFNSHEVLLCAESFGGSKKPEEYHHPQDPHGLLMMTSMTLLAATTGHPGTLSHICQALDSVL